MPELRRHVVGAVASLWRYPVKSMLGEELRTARLLDHGLVGDRAYALIDRFDGKVATAKNPKKWPYLFAFRSRLLESAASSRPASLHITLPDQRVVYGEQSDIGEVLSAALGREVMLVAAEHAPAALRGSPRPAAAHRDPLVARAMVVGDDDAPGSGTESAPASSATPGPLVAEAYMPDIEGLALRDSVVDFRLAAGTFFDASSIHLLTTATLARLRELYPAGRFDPRRFRPNLVVDTGGDPGFVEGAWIGSTLAVGDEVRLAVTARCGRCVMTTLAQDDLPVDRGILHTAIEHDRAKVGVYADVVRGGTIRAGDRVEVMTE